MDEPNLNRQVLDYKISSEGLYTTEKKPIQPQDIANILNRAKYLSSMHTNEEVLRRCRKPEE